MQSGTKYIIQKCMHSPFDYDQIELRGETVVFLNMDPPKVYSEKDALRRPLDCCVQKTAKTILFLHARQIKQWLLVTLTIYYPKFSISTLLNTSFG